MANQETDLRCYLTNAGIAAENNSIQLGRKLPIKEMVFGSGLLADSGDPRLQTAMIKEEYVVPCGMLFDPESPTLLVFKGDLPADVGGFHIHEVAIRLEDGTLYGYARGKGDYKPTLEQGATDSVRYAIEMYTTNASIVECKIDLSKVYVDWEDLEVRVKAHKDEPEPHSQYHKVEEQRLINLDKYGHTAFISGFNVVKLTANDYRIDPGIVYVGGLRCELKMAETRTITVKPSGIYIDVVRKNNASMWANIPTIKASNTPLSDYVDEQGYQHYVARLAGVDASGNVQDWREWDIVSQTEAEEGTSAIRRFWSALRITQLISAWWNRSAMKTKLDGIQEGAQANVATNLATTADATSRTVTSSTGTNAVLPAVSASAAGVMTVLQRAKLEGIQAGAQVNVATNLATTADATSRTVTSSTGANAIFPAATTTVAGVMTASDKAKLNGIQAGAQVNRPLGSGAGQVCEGNDPRLSNAREWIADIVPQAEAEAGTSSTARKWTAQRVRQAVIAQAPLASRRVGETYVQFPGQATPASLFGGTWSALFDNEGVFFRTPGNHALLFNAGIQTDAMQKVTGEITGVQGWVSGGSSGALRRTQTQGNGTGGSAHTTNNLRVNFDSSLSPDARTASETRPRNRTIRVWVKTA